MVEQGACSPLAVSKIDTDRCRSLARPRCVPISIGFAHNNQATISFAHNNFNLEPLASLRFVRTAGHGLRDDDGAVRGEIHSVREG